MKTTSERSSLEAKPINMLKTEFKLLGKLGSGGFSSVYLVESLNVDKKLYAAKFQVKTQFLKSFICHSLVKIK